MLKSQAIQLKINEVRAEIDAAVENIQKTGAAPDEAAKAKLTELRAGYAAQNELLQAALIAEDVMVREDTADPAAREQRDLVDRATLARYAFAAAREQDVDGVEAEARAALFGDMTFSERHVPMEMLLPPGHRQEYRADTATDLSAVTGPTQTRNIIARIFQNTVADFLGVSMPAVGAGTASFPVLTGGTAAEMKAAGAAVDAAAATVSVTGVDPGRLTARYKWRLEDTVKFPDLEEALRRDIRAAMREELDDQVLNGDGVAPNRTGFMAELTAPANPSAVVDWAGFSSTMDAEIDGLYATAPGQLRMLIGKATYQKAASTYQSNTTVSAYDYASGRFGGLRMTNKLAVPASNVQQALLAKNLPDGRETATAPMWRAMEMIRDPYTSAASGEIAMTAVTLFGFKVIREAAFKIIKYKLA